MKQVRQNSVRAGHSYIVRKDGYTIDVSFARVGSGYVVATSVDYKGSHIKQEVAETDEDPFSSLTQYDLSQRLAEEIDKIKSMHDYLAKNRILDSIVGAADPRSELEKSLDSRDRKGRVAGNTLRYALDQYRDYDRNQQDRAEMPYVNRSGPEPPKSDPRILARDSLPPRPFDFLGTVQYEPPSQTTSARCLDEMPELRKPQRSNPSIRPGEFALHSQAYRRMATGEKFAPLTQKKS